MRKRRVCSGSRWLRLRSLFGSHSAGRNLLLAAALRIAMVDVDALLSAPIATADATTTLKSVIAGKKTLLLFVRNFA